VKTREEVARFIEEQMEGASEPSKPKGKRYHYGAQELRDLMDFVFGGEPLTDAERITLKHPNKWPK
jgi:hypothetical protein